MSRWKRLAVALTAAAALAACGSRGTQDADQGRAASPGTEGAQGTSGSTTRSDVDFVKDAVQGGKAEVALGRLAEKQAQSQAVKDFGVMMVRDHSKANADLKPIADKLNVSTADRVGGKLDSEHQDLYERLSKMSGPDFDREYMDAMVKDHQKDVSEFQEQANSKNGDSAAKQFASETLPTLEKHLDRAKTIKKELEKNPNGAEDDTASTAKPGAATGSGKPKTRPHSGR